MSLTALILTYNESERIERCIASLSFCDTVLVVDNYSTDDTVAKAKKAGAQTIQQELDSFSAQRTFAMKQAQTEWVLFVDADEVVPSELAEEIKATLVSPSFDAYFLKRIDFWCNRELRFGELTAARTKGFIRLMKQDSGTWKGNVHETFLPTGTAGRLNHALHHYPHASVTEFLLDINEYSTMRARELYEQQYPFRITDLLLKPNVKFLYTFFWLQGYRDGAPGFIYSFMMSFHSFLVRAKLYQYRVTSE
jgi:glycosyltransferase involved in cell wall biosynthesis